mgnify:CR=1 FL=1|jgi:plastocyanin
MKLEFLKEYFLKTIRFFVISLACVFCVYATTIYAHKSEKDNVVIVHVNDNGFEPKKVHIKINTEVVFENVGKEEHWPAADDHPSHTLYDGTSLEEHCAPKNTSSFDACKSLKSGETWSFVFKKDGVYEYHDHVWPQFKGEIVVGDSENVIVRQNKNMFSRFVDFLKKIFSVTSSFFAKNEERVTLKSGNTDTESYVNLKKRYEKIVTESDPRKAISVLEEESSVNENTLALCHDILHVIGHTAFDKYGSFKEAMKYQNDFCNSGYIHGLFESYFHSVEKPLAGLSEQCSEGGVGKRQFDIWQCHHGIGHGFMYLTGGDLDKSLQLCGEGLQKPDDISSCQNGVYMEVFNLEILAKEKYFVDPANPFLTCQSRQTNKGDCYLYISTYLSQTIGKDFTDIFKECNKAELGYSYACVEGVGSEAMKRNMNNSNDVFALCKQAGSYAKQEACVSGAVNMYMNQKSSAVAGKELCARTPESYQAICYQTVAEKESFFK